MNNCLVISRSNIMSILTLKKYLLFIWNTNLPGQSAFLFAKSGTAWNSSQSAPWERTWVTVVTVGAQPSTCPWVKWQGALPWLSPPTSLKAAIEPGPVGWGGEGPSWVALWGHTHVWLCLESRNLIFAGKKTISWWLGLQSWEDWEGLP